MPARLALAALLMGVSASNAGACSARSWDPNELVGNEAVYSENGRFCAVVRWYKVADFTSERAGTLFHLDEPIKPDDHNPVDANPDVPVPPRTVTVAWYELARGSRRLLAEIPVEAGRIDDVLVADSGLSLIATRFRNGGCSGWPTGDDALVTIYRADGHRVGGVTVADVLSANDIRFHLNYVSVQFELRHESDRRDVIVIAIDTNLHDEPRRIERRIDVTTALPLDGRDDIFPLPRAYATPVTTARPQRAYGGASPQCASAWLGKVPVPIESSQLFAQAIHGPLPQFPEIAIKARMRGPVLVEVIVSESGDVVCTRHTPLPFGMDQAADEAARRWKFRPFLVHGQPVQIIGELLFRFEDLDEPAWREVVRQSPPGD